MGQWRAHDEAGYSALASRIRLLVVDGRLRAGTRLPSERDLALRLGVSRTMVNSAYHLLRDGGFLVSRHGSGSVARLPGRTSDLPIPGFSDALDLSRATSAASPGLHGAAQRALERLPARFTTDGYELLGHPDAREAIAARFTERGLPTSADQIAITTGAQGAIALIARTFCTRGDRVLVEVPGYPHANDAFRGVGARLVPLMVDPDHGWDVDRLALTLPRFAPAVAYLMPDFHNPTSRSMTELTRSRVAELAEAHGVVVVVDETTAELDIDRGWKAAPFGALGDVITVGSASKTVWGGLRIGWIRGSMENIDRIVATRFSQDLGASVLDQLIFTEMLTDFDPVLDYRRKVHQESRAALERALREHLPDSRISAVDGGVAAWVHLSEPISSALVSGARVRGLLLGAGPWFGLSGEFERNLRVPITARPEAIEQAMAVLGEVRRDLSHPHDEQFRGAVL
jgi:DNA-binding transcriptional MocR family regulator